MIETIRHRLQTEGTSVSIAKLCRWFEVPRRTVYYKAVKAEPKVGPRYAEPIKAMIEESPSFGYRTVAYLLGFNKNTVQRYSSSRAGTSKSGPLASGLAFGPCHRWRRRRTNGSTDLCRIWAGRDDSA
ncbi:hypothetical protein [Achromobacter aloeverae]|uniref:hypothetical protein n=1 Tax=Achromobacter aloeverae TaxID=1750518 RepID=UPI001F01BEA1|nr:hypothetical protein [Achromobacter aloeverae]